ncbi:MAG: hypothetical protein WB998_05045 [Solirubrobacteraceae bacterium]
MQVVPIFPKAKMGAGMYESFYLRAVSPDQPLGVWIRYTVHKRPDRAGQGSIWCTVFDARRGAPFTHKHTSAELEAPSGGWIAIGADSRLGPGGAQGVCGPARWSLRFEAEAPELRHLAQSWLYKAPLPRTKLTSPAPAARFSGTVELPDRTLRLDGWRGMVGHNWGSEHAERWIWLHGIGFAEDPSAWIDVALGRVLVAGRLTPWLASGAISWNGQVRRLGGLGARGLRVAENVARCSLSIPGEAGLTVEAHVDAPPGASAGWRYADPDGGEHDVVNCSVAALALNVRPRGEAARTLHTAHGAAYELGMVERDHGVELAPFPDG